VLCALGIVLSFIKMDAPILKRKSRRFQKQAKDVMVVLDDGARNAY
jgi:hypothetical protein